MRYEAAKRKSGKNLVFYTGSALQNGAFLLGNKRFLFLGGASPAFAYSPRCAPGYSAQSGSGTKVCATGNPT